MRTQAGERKEERRARYIANREAELAAERANREAKKRAAMALQARNTKRAVRHERIKEKARQKQRVRYSRDFLGFYRELYASKAVDKVTKKPYSASLGEIHNFVSDFLNLGLPKSVKRYSALHKYMPKDQGEEWAERWLYWPTLASKPVVQDGPDGVVSTMFHERAWQGLVIRLKGKLKRAMLLPRGHLKSEIITKAHTTWRICRDPSERNLIQSRDQRFARELMSGIKSLWEREGKFKELYGHLMPTGYDAQAWAADYFQLKCKDPRGTAPTVAAFGIGGSTTGTHVETIVLDDLITPETTGGEDGATTKHTNTKITQITGVLDPGSMLLNVGTPWAINDGHSLFTNRDGAFYDDSSFFVATVVDSDPKGCIPKELCIASRGNPMWKEKFPLHQISMKRRGMPIDQEYFGQYFCQLTGTQATLFHKDWITYYDDKPEEIAKLKKCNIFVAVDTASGKFNGVKKGKFDPTGMIVMGQSSTAPDDWYVLDGCKEYIAAEDMAVAIVDMALYWKKFADKNDLFFKMGFEETVYTAMLKPMIDQELTKRGLEGIFEIESLQHANRQKETRIRLLAAPYSHHWISWPKKLIKAQKKGEPYDLIQELKDEFVGYPMVAHEELLDCQAYVVEMAGPQDYQDRAGEAKPGRDPSRYVRKKFEATEDGEVVEAMEQDVGVDEDDLSQYAPALGGY